MLVDIGTSNKTITQYAADWKGSICLFSAGENGYGGADIVFKVEKNILSVATYGTSGTSKVGSAYMNDARKVDRYLATPRQISPEVAVLVKVK